MLTGTHATLADLLAFRFEKMAAAKHRTSIVGHRAGSKLSNFKGRGVDLAEVRAYQPGDDVRSIDWRVTARTNKTHTKIFREERERPILIVVDQTQNMFFGSTARLKSVCAAEIAARMAWQTVENGDRVGGVVIGNENFKVHRPYRSSKGVARLLNDIAEENNNLARGKKMSRNLLKSMIQIRRLAHHNYRVAIVSDFSGPLPEWQEHLQSIARHNQVLLVHVYDVLEQELPPSDYYMVSDGETRLSFFSGDGETRQRYLHRFAERQAGLSEICRHEHMSFVGVATHEQDINEMSWL